MVLPFWAAFGTITNFWFTIVARYTVLYPSGTVTWANPVAASASARTEVANILVCSGSRSGVTEFEVWRRQQSMRRGTDVYISPALFLNPHFCGVSFGVGTSLISREFPGYVNRLMFVHIQGSSHFSVIGVLCNLSTPHQIREGSHGSPIYKSFHSSQN